MHLLPNYSIIGHHNHNSGKTGEIHIQGVSKKNEIRSKCYIFLYSLISQLETIVLFKVHLLL